MIGVLLTSIVLHLGWVVWAIAVPSVAGSRREYSSSFGVPISWSRIDRLGRTEIIANAGIIYLIGAAESGEVFEMPTSVPVIPELRTFQSSVASNSSALVMGLRSYGWPCRATAYEWYQEKSGTVRVSGGVLLDVGASFVDIGSGRTRVVPIRVDLVFAVLNGLFVYILVRGARQAVRHLCEINRARMGLCKHCGYPRHVHDSCCPECGAVTS